MTAEELQTGLANHIGTEGYTKYLGGLVLTDGVVYLAKNAECFWLLDIIWSYQPQCRKDSMLRDMQFWTVNVEGSSAVVTCERDKGDVAIRQEVPYTSFPIQGETKIWVELGSVDGVNPAYVVMLPSER